MIAKSRVMVSVTLDVRYNALSLNQFDGLNSIVFCWNKTDGIERHFVYRFLIHNMLLPVLKLCICLWTLFVVLKDDRCAKIKVIFGEREWVSKPKRNKPGVGQRNPLTERDYLPSFQSPWSFLWHKSKAFKFPNSMKKRLYHPLSYSALIEVFLKVRSLAYNFQRTKTTRKPVSIFSFPGAFPRLRIKLKHLTLILKTEKKVGKKKV